jgi:hypothetical protein
MAGGGANSQTLSKQATANLKLETWKAFFPFAKWVEADVVAMLNRPVEPQQATRLLVEHVHVTLPLWSCQCCRRRAAPRHYHRPKFFIDNPTELIEYLT